MAEKLKFDDGVKRLDVNGNGLLCFNPSDPNVYQRLCTLLRELPELEKQYHVQVEMPDGEISDAEVIALGGEILGRAREIDAGIKKKLAWVFGPENDFDKLLDGVNLMAFGGNGERVITNFVNAIKPYLEDGLRQHRQGAAAEAVAAAKKNRAKRAKQ